MRNILAFIVLGVVVQVGLVQAESSDSKPKQAQFRILWTGGTGGVSQHVGRNRAHLELARVGSLSPLWEGPLAFAKDGLFLFHPERLTVQRFQQFLAAGPFKKSIINDGVGVAESPFEFILAWPGNSADFLKVINGQRDQNTRLTQKSSTLARYENSRGEVVFGLEVRPGTTLMGPPHHWETRFMFKGEWRLDDTTQTIYSFGRPVHDGARRMTALKDLQAKDGARIVTLSAGNDMETVSFLDSTQPDGQRPVTWDAWVATKIDAVVPGASELIFGIPKLLETSKTRGVSLLSSNLTAPGILPWQLFEHEGAQLLLVGVTDRDSMRMDIAITAPAITVAHAVESSTKQLGRRPDVVLVIGHLSPTSRATLERDSDQMDFLITDFADHGIHGEAITQVATGLTDKVFRAYDRRPITLVRAGRNRLGLLDLTLRRRASGPGFVVERVVSKALPVFSTQRPNSRIAEKIQGIRQTAYGQGQIVVLPSVQEAIDGHPAVRALFESDPTVKQLSRGNQRQLGRLSPRLWRMLCVRAFRDAMNAQVAILPQFPVPWVLSGPVTRLQISANIPLPDTARRVNVDAKTMLRLMIALRQLNLITSGIDLSGNLVRGRKVDLRMSYNIAIPDGLTRHPALAPILAKGKSIGRFTPMASGYRPSKNGDEVAIARVITKAFEGMGRLTSQAIVGRLMDDGAAKTARWLVEANDITLSMSRYSTQGGQAAYANVRETRVTTKNNRSIGVRGEVNLLREGTDINWSNRATFGFDKAYYEDAEDQETNDALRFTTELQLPLLGVLGAVPYGSIAYATEFTPTESDEGENPRKKQVEGNLGLAWKYKKLRISRLGLLVTRDYASDIAEPQMGVNASTDLRFPMGRVTLFCTGEARYFVPDIGRDDDTELGLTVAVRAGLYLKLFRGFALSIYGDSYVYRGQVETTDSVGSSFIGGLGLTYDQRLRLAGE